MMEREWLVNFLFRLPSVYHKPSSVIFVVYAMKIYHVSYDYVLLLMK